MFKISVSTHKNCYYHILIRIYINSVNKLHHIKFNVVINKCTLSLHYYLKNNRLSYLQYL